MKRMSINKNIFLKAVLCIIALSAMQSAHAFISEKAQGLGFAMTALGLAVLQEEIAESETFGKVARFCNMDTQDLTSSLVFSSALWAASYVPEGSGRTVLRLCAIVPVLASACLPKKAITKLANLPGIKQFFGMMREAKGLPLIGDMVQCNQLDCHGLCQTCKARKLFLTVPFAAIPFIPTVYRSVNATIARWERERIEQAERNQDERRQRQATEDAHQAAVGHTNENNYYATLGIDRNATQQEIRRAHLQAAQRFNSDHFIRNQAALRQLGINSVQDADARMAQINEAAGVLENPGRKAAYDRGLRL